MMEDSVSDVAAQDHRSKHIYSDNYDRDKLHGYQIIWWKMILPI